MFFDERLRTKAILNNFDGDQSKWKTQQVIIRVILYITTIIFICTPMFQATRWCLNRLETHGGTLKSDTLVLDCQQVGLDEKIPYSNMLMLNPRATSSVSILCLIIFILIKIARARIRKRNQSNSLRETVFYVMVAISILDFIVDIVMLSKPWVADLLRPLILVVMFKSQLEFYFLVGYNIRDSAAMIFCILVWTVYFAQFVQFVFADTAGGITTFSTFK